MYETHHDWQDGNGAPIGRATPPPAGFPHNGTYRPHGTAGSARWSRIDRPVSHRAMGPGRWTAPTNGRRTRPADATRWHWLLLVPVAVPLSTPLYNRVDPTVLGFPFFYWFQLVLAAVSAFILGFVYLLTRKRV